VNRPSLLGLGLAVVGTAAIAGLSRLPYDATPSGQALLRLSWRYQPDGSSGCRRPTEEELAELPPHMRNPNACISAPVPYHLTVVIDGETIVDERILAGGARQDRPVFVFREFDVAAGEHEIEIRFEARPEEPDGTEPLSLSWAEPVMVRPREIALIGYDRETGRLFRHVGGQGP